MKEMQLDFANRTLAIPANLTSNPLTYSNLIRKDNEGLQVEFHNGQGEPLIFLLDTSLSTSIMSAHWYNNHKELAQSTGAPDRLHPGGIGGVVQQTAI